ncbi:uridine kinase [Prauserella sp. PE36]|uniref:Uridine kinase n=1 Tax=Prauserella endophytica TaxID=1592324 RepID=A0ABY2S7R0_9PSEU|nr:MULTISPECIES: uridine kinase [Prauserella]PXY21716.1 uridine kinase [Prauserella coralliicola]RBM20095.1 uridine kinase [Prauserella sp. PE36]TKG71501.1 uridine kinase [Prauserella endophytica]
MSYRPISPERLVDELTDRIADLPARPWTRVVVDGAGPEPARLADALVDPLRVLGREVLRVSAWDFLRPASLRLERGRHDPDVRYEDWLDVSALRREVLDPLAPDGSGEVLPALWDRDRDRAHRLRRTRLPNGAVLLLDGELLLGRGLAVELAVHLWLSPAARERTLPRDEAWALPAYTRYDREVRPDETADVVVRMDHPRNPAMRISPPA